MSARAALLDQRVAWLAVELGELLVFEQELSPAAREALLAICAEVAGALERAKLEELGRRRYS
jgi:hypothetical protein